MPSRAQPQNTAQQAQPHHQPTRPGITSDSAQNQKGGVGKTTTAVNLAVCLARTGGGVLAIDCDPQATMTRQLGIELRGLGVNLVDVLAGRAAAEDAVIADVVEGVDVIPAARELAGVEMTLVGELGRERFLAEALEPLKDRYRVIAIARRARRMRGNRIRAPRGSAPGGDQQMSRLRKTGLSIDDPLSTAKPATAAEFTRLTVDKKTSAPGRPSPKRRAANVERRAAPARGGAWRSWSGPTRVASYRIPDELLAELASTSAELRLPVGLLVTAAIAHLLDEAAEVIADLVDWADDARIEGRRAARRGLITAPDDADAASAVGDTL